MKVFETGFLSRCTTVSLTYRIPFADSAMSSIAGADVELGCASFWHTTLDPECHASCSRAKDVPASVGLRPAVTLSSRRTGGTASWSRSARAQRKAGVGEGGGSLLGRCPGGQNSKSYFVGFKNHRYPYGTRRLLRRITTAECQADPIPPHNQANCYSIGPPMPRNQP